MFNRVPSLNGPSLTLFRSTQLVKLQGLTRVLNRLYVLLPIATLLLFAGGVALSSNRRRGVVRAATGLALSMGLVLVVASVLRHQYLSSLGPSQSKPAAAAVIDSVDAVLLDRVRITLIVAAVIAIVAVLLGNSWIRSWLANRRKPAWMLGGRFHDFAATHRKGLQWGVLGLGMLILVLWNEPTAVVAVVVVLIALALVGLVGLIAGRGTSSATGVSAPFPDLPDGAPAVGTGPGRERAVAALGPGETDADP